MLKNLYLIVGPSGSGKTTIANRLEKDYGYRQVYSYTTRPARYPGETSHVFLSDEAFDSLEHIVSYTEYNGYRYAATQELLNHCDVFVVDPPGVEYLLKHIDKNRDIKIVCMEISETIRALRMMERGDELSQILERLEVDSQWFKKDKLSFVPNFYISELNLDKAVESIHDWICKLEET